MAQSYATSADMVQVRDAFDLINRTRRLPMMLETFLGEWRDHTKDDCALILAPRRGRAEELSSHSNRGYSAYGCL